MLANMLEPAEAAPSVGRHKHVPGFAKDAHGHTSIQKRIGGRSDCPRTMKQIDCFRPVKTGAQVLGSPSFTYRPTPIGLRQARSLDVRVLVKPKRRGFFLCGDMQHVKVLF